MAAGLRNRFVYSLGADEDANGPVLHRLEKRALERGILDAFVFGSGVIPEVHVFVPLRNAGPEDMTTAWMSGPARTASMSLADRVTPSSAVRRASRPASRPTRTVTPLGASGTDTVHMVFGE